MAKFSLEAAIQEHIDAGMELPNIWQLRQHLMAIPKSQWRSTFFVCYDIDHLRKINFSYGYDIGDMLLREVAGWVTQMSGETLYSIGGDMFCLVMHNKTFEQALDFAKSAVSRSHHCWRLPNNRGEGGDLEVFVTASIAVVPVDEYVLGQNLIALFERCLEESEKTKGVAVFCREADRRAREHVRLQMDLKSCIFKGMEGFSLCYQPIVDPASTLWRGVEALCRWNRPGYGPVSPTKFIPEAERMGLMTALGKWILETAVDTCAQLKLYEIPGFFLSVNASALQISQPDFDLMVADLLAQKGYPPRQLNLEITESSEVSFDDGTRATIENLCRLGVTLALDDFGTGYSSFNLLKNLPAQYVKTEREFIFDIDKNDYLQYSMYVISETAHLNGMRLICEGVETLEQLHSAVDNGADLVQGYYYSKPLDRQTLEASIGRFKEGSGRPALERYAAQFNFNQWISSKEAYNITPSLFKLLYQCMDLMINGGELDCTVNKILGTVGEYFNVNHVFVFLDDGHGFFDNKYEWCAQGVQSQMHLFQHMDYKADGFGNVLDKEDLVITATESQLPLLLRERLLEGGQTSSIQSTIVYPMKRRGKTVGFVGFDDSCSREWMPEEILLLHNLCLLFLLKFGIQDN